jgi:hypothetical protein
MVGTTLIPGKAQHVVTHTQVIDTTVASNESKQVGMKTENYLHNREIISGVLLAYRYETVYAQQKCY